MTSRWELEIPHGREEEVRQFVSGLEGVKIRRDGGKIREVEETRNRQTHTIVEQLLDPVNPENVDKISSGYKQLFHDVYRRTGYELVQTHIDSAEDIQRTAKVLVEAFKAGDLSKLQNFAVLIGGYGLVTGEPVALTKAASLAGYKTYNRRMWWNCVRQIQLTFSRNQYPEILEVRPRN